MSPPSARLGARSNTIQPRERTALRSCRTHSETPCEETLRPQPAGSRLDTSSSSCSICASDEQPCSSLSFANSTPRPCMLPRRCCDSTLERCSSLGFAQPRTRTARSPIRPVHIIFQTISELSFDIDHFKPMPITTAAPKAPRPRAIDTYARRLEAASSRPGE